MWNGYFRYDYMYIGCTCTCQYFFVNFDGLIVNCACNLSIHYCVVSCVVEYMCQVTARRNL